MPSYVIVGASRGIGHGFLKNLSADPSNTVIGLARNPSAVEPIPNVTILKADLLDPASLNAAASRATTLTPDGAIDHLIVNGAYLGEASAFIAPSGFVGKEAFFLSELQTSMATNVAGVLYSINAFLPLVKKSRIKKVVVLSSGMADTECFQTAGLPHTVAYAISKAGVNVLVAKYAVEFKDEGIKFLALSPGVVGTSDFRQLSPEDQEGYAKMAAGFAKTYPDFKGPVAVEESVGRQLEVIHGLTLAQSGQFLSHRGNKEWL
ncbi:putative short-chain dehydrogenase [Massarina eburnea CBS 473.64]|uniref:Putative short-chain dehydrogenase n=1 Tax=Massarina eburnea CBS 473.64 TaxID=1395130 RepID=A0A6A6RSR6_9PLEO|nr:putative short-chain dehydrogenase [Massarina eburnea CBS 473.64]